MKTIVTLDKANQPYGFSQLDGSGSLHATGSLFGTSSWASNAISSSYTINALTASYVLPLHQNVQLTGSLLIEGGNPIQWGNGNAYIQSGMGFHISSEEGISIDTVDVTDPQNPVYKNWFFNPNGTLTIPGNVIIGNGNTINASDVNLLLTPGISGSIALANNNLTQYLALDDNGAYTNDLIVSGRLESFNTTGSLFGTASWAENFNETDPIFTAVSGTFATTGSNLFTDNQSIDAGSTEGFGSGIKFINPGFAHYTAGISGSTFVVADTSANYYVPWAGADIKLQIGATNSTFNTNVEITGSLKVSEGITGSLFGTSSYSINAATSSHILGGKATHIPYFITDTTLATSSLYQSGSTSIIINQDTNTVANPEALYVWQPHPTSINVISGKGDLDNYLQLNIQNTSLGSNASSDIVATANNGSEADNYIDMGINSQNFDGFLGGPNDSYLYSHGHNMWVGNINDGYEINLFNSSSLQPIITLTAQGQANITGSLYGTASWALNSLQADNATQAVSASHALQADNATTATTANTALNGGVTSIIAGSGITLPFGGTGNVTIVAGAGGGGVTIISGSAVTSSFVSLDTWVFDHNLGTRTPTITVFDSDYNQIIPQNIQLVSTASAVITFPTLESGFAIASTGGTTGTALSSSYSLFATYADSASYYPEKDPIFTAKSGSFATTGSNIFKGNQTITGSVYINSGSSLNLNGTTLYSSASTLFTNANLVPTVHNVQSLGTTTTRWKDVWIGSGTVYIADSVIPNSDLAIEAINNILTISGSAGLEVGSFKFIDNELFLKNEGIPIIIGSGSSTAPVELHRPLDIVSGETGNITFRATREGRVAIIPPNIPAGDIGAFSIIGNSSGSYQPVTNTGGMVHVTGNNGASSRITNDAFGTGSVAAYVGRAARGTALAPLNTVSGDIITRLSAIGWGYNGFNQGGGPATTAIELVAAENFTTSSIGTKTNFYNAPIGGLARTLAAQIDTTGITIPSSSLLYGTASWALNSRTASYATNGGVTQILAGANITLSPTNGLGQVTVTAATPGGAGGNSLTSSYGAFYSTQQQPNTVANTPNSMSFNTTYISNGVSISGSTNTKIKVDQPGAYNLTFTAQIDRTDDAVKPVIPVTIWLRKNGSDLAYTAVAETVDIKSTNYVAAWNYMLSAAANDYYEIMWKSDYTTIALTPLAGSPLGPSVSATVSRVDLASSNTGSFTGSFTGVLVGSASYATTSSYALNGGVTQIIAGNNVTITNGGSGSVTINAATTGNAVDTGSFAITGSNTFIGNQIITGSLTLNSGSALNINDGFYVNGNKQFNYGQFISTATQSGSLNVSASFTYNNTVYSNGVTLVSGSRLTVQNTGVYKIDVSAATTSGGVAATYTWLKKNGTNVANTNFHVDISIKNYVYAITPSYIVTGSAGDYFEVARQFDIAGTTYPATAAAGNLPTAPSITTTITQIA